MFAPSVGTVHHLTLACSLGALLHGSRDAVGAGACLKCYDIDNLPGAVALRQLMLELTGKAKPAGEAVECEGGAVRYVIASPVPEVRSTGNYSVPNECGCCCVHPLRCHRIDGAACWFRRALAAGAAARSQGRTVKVSS